MPIIGIVFMGKKMFGRLPVRLQECCSYAILEGMFEIRVVRSFSGAHRLRGYRGKCEKLHGHNWRVEAELVSSKLNREGISVDFKLLKKELDKAIRGLDHTVLNNLKEFRTHNPSAENIARFIFEKLKGRFGKKAKLRRVIVWETESSSASYTEALN